MDTHRPVPPTPCGGLPLLQVSTAIIPAYVPRGTASGQGQVRSGKGQPPVHSNTPCCTIQGYKCFTSTSAQMHEKRQVPN